MPIPIGLATTTIIERGLGPQTYSVYAVETTEDVLKSNMIDAGGTRINQSSSKEMYRSNVLADL